MSAWSKQNKNSSSYSNQSKKSISWTKQKFSVPPGKFDVAKFDKSKFDRPQGTHWKNQSKN